MIISRTPFRISFAGGGTDLPAFYEREYGAVVSTTIDKYMFIQLHKRAIENKILLKYSKTEEVDKVDDIKHGLIRESMKLANVNDAVEISSIAHFPGGTGLGSSSSYTVGLLNALYAYQHEYPEKEILANQACHIEINKNGAPIGKQDQYAAAYGGLNYVRFNTDGTVQVKPIKLSMELKQKLDGRLMLFYTGVVRDANEILKEQSEKTVSERDKFENLIKMRNLANELRDHLEMGDISTFGKILHKGWLLKRELTTKISSPKIDDWYARAREAGAEGGKILGAGGGGFLLFYVPEDKQEAVKKALPELRHIPFCFDDNGSTILYRHQKAGSKQLYSNSKSMYNFARGYLNYLTEIFSRIDHHKIEKIAKIMMDAREKDKQIFFIGNGGSASTAMHFVCDLAKGTKVPGKRPFRTISLADNTSWITALGNDEGYEQIFVGQLQNLLNSGDVVIGISASGNSPNVLKAFEYSNSMKATTIAIVGFDGGKMKDLATEFLLAPTPKGEYGPVEDVHMIVDHLITNYIFEHDMEEAKIIRK